ncbi:MAG: hypothetical protein FJ404_12170 [Verrucomicrobia bacterium]|nr:hypothetical protein [Verrucomicrobiota bacterium]
MNISPCLRAAAAAVFFFHALSTSLAESSGPAGAWKWTTQTQNGESREWVLDLRWENGKLLGKLKGPRNETEIQEGRYAEGQVSFKVTRETQRGTLQSTYQGKLDGDTLKGKVETKNGERTNEREWVAKREGLDVSGAWAWSMKRENGDTMEATFTLSRSNGQLAGKFESEGLPQPLEIKNAKIEGNTLTFDTVLERDGASTTIKNSATISGKTMKGKAEGTREGQSWTREWEATRK